MARWAEFDWGGESGAASELPPGFVEAFTASMPPRYRVLFDPRATRRHAAVSYRRGVRPANAEVWRTHADGSAALCVVADDRPGLLSAIAAALVFHRLDVITALVFSRASERGVVEAVDLLWVRRANAQDAVSIDDDEAASVGQVLAAILSGHLAVEQIAAQAAAARGGDDPVTVRLEDVDGEGLAGLVVEASDRPGMLLTIAFEVFQHGAQIVRSLVRTAGGRAYNHFELAEFSGAPLSAERRKQIRDAVHAALTLRDVRDRM
jgi:[protein-PII] uridylyltransferase